MDQHSKAELVRVLQKQYRKASKKQKSGIIDHLVAAAGYSRKHAIRRLTADVSARRAATRNRPRVYAAVREPLTKLWAIADGICSRRLQPFLPELISSLKQHSEICLTDEQEQLLLSISPATIDRLLASVRQKLLLKGHATTKPGTLLKHQIPVRTFADWDDQRPGFLEVDLVAHCGDSTGGEFINTLNLTDVASGWTICSAFMGRSQRFCVHAIRLATNKLPFPILGLDSDNDAAFINAHLSRYCQEQSITFTRSRPYRKNDQCHVEQKNWDVVRKTIGYARFDTSAQLAIIRRIYNLLAIYQNYFQPSRKLISKTRIGSRVKRNYDSALTPCQRLLRHPDTSPETRHQLQATFEQANPAELIRSIHRLSDELYDTLPDGTIPR